MDRRRAGAPHPRAPSSRETRPVAGPERRGACSDAGRVRPQSQRQNACLFRPSGQDPGQDEGARLRRLSQRGGRFGARASGRQEGCGPRIHGACWHGWRRQGRRPRRHRALARGALGLAAGARRRDHRFSEIRARGESHRARDPPYSPCLFGRDAERGRGRAARSVECAARGLACAAACDHRSARREGS